MKRILLAMLLCIVSLTSFSQVIKFETTSYTYKEYTSYGWTKWAPYEHSSMLLTMDIDRDLVIIHSPRTQIYKIVDYSGTYTDRDGDSAMEFKFIDQDGDRGTMRLMQRRSGKSEVYIQFANIIWCYSVKRL